MTVPEPGKLRVYRYGLAIGSVAGAIAVTRLLSGLGDSGISPQFFAAVLVTAWYGGLGPGLLATLLSGIGTAYLLTVSHPMPASAIREDVLRVLVFTVVAVITSSLHAASRRAREAAESASAAKSQFLAMVSHELRTPLSPVLMATEMLLDDPLLPARVQADLETIRRNVQLEIRLISDLLDLTRISTGKLLIRSDLTDVHETLTTAADFCASDMRDKQQTIDLLLAAEHCCILGDAVRLQQIFWNLLRNATKFTPNGGRITVTTENTDGDMVVQVRDTGIGIDAKRLTTIFGAFEQGDAALQADVGGLGLGLAIAKALVTAHGGTISAASEGKGRGATFTVRFPIVRPSAATTGDSVCLKRSAATEARDVDVAHAAVLPGINEPEHPRAQDEHG